MIKLDIEPYCQECAHFEAEVERTNIFADHACVKADTHVRCTHKLFCRNILNMLKENLQQEEKSNDTN